MLVNEMPHGGLKQSGYGKDMSLYALEDYTVVRHVMINARLKLLRVRAGVSRPGPSPRSLQPARPGPA